MRALDDAALAARTDTFRARIAATAAAAPGGAGSAAADAAVAALLDELLLHAFAVVREAARRVLGMRHFDSQLVGGREFGCDHMCVECVCMRVCV